MNEIMYRHYTIKLRPAWGGGVTAIIFYRDTFIRDVTSNDRCGAIRAAQNVIDGRYAE